MMDSRYEVVICWSEEDGCFLAHVPELPGCMADGASRREVIVNVERAIDEWIDTARSLDRPIPEPGARLIQLG